MKIGCLCGDIITDQTDALPWMGHIIPDQEWFPVFDAIDRIIDETKSGLLEVEAAYMQLRRVLGDASKPVYQCGSCGRIFIFEPRDPANIYKPEFETTSRQILRSSVAPP